MNQLSEISRNFLVVLFFLSVFGASSQLYKKDLDSISSLIQTKDFPAARSFTLEAKIRNDERAGSHWLTKSNLLLGNIYVQEDDFGKAIIHYLEGIRYSKDANYDHFGKDLAMLYYSCGLVFAKFRAYSLAEEYYTQGLEYAELHSLPVIAMSHKYTLAGIFTDTKRSSEAIKLLSESISSLESNSRMYFIFSNRLGFTYHESEQFQKSVEIYEKLINELSEDDWIRKGSYHHNLARSYRESKNYEKALSNYQKAINFKQLAEDEKTLFSSYYGISETHFALEDYESSENYFSKAEDLMELQPLHPDYFEIYKACANLNYTLQDYQKSKHYEDLYSDKMNEYLVIQSEIQETDQRYNMDLITKRYFAEVDKQDRVASILMYSKLSSGSLLTLLLFVIGFHRYQKVMLRRSIERELIALKIV